MDLLRDDALARAELLVLFAVAHEHGLAGHGGPAGDAGAGRSGLGFGAHGPRHVDL